MKKYKKPEYQIEACSTEDIMSSSMVVTEEEDTLRGRIDIESLIDRIHTIKTNIFKN